jgi:hypothetical protein
MRKHTITAYDYVNRPFSAVQTAIANPQLVLERATAATSGTIALHATLGGIDVGTEVVAEISEVLGAESPLDRPKLSFAIQWHAAHRRELFPTMHATLSVYPLTPTETQVELAGTYDPPLGAIGAAIDAVAMHQVAEASIDNLVRELAGLLRRELAA